jgi:hypothetical protein
MPVGFGFSVGDFIAGIEVIAKVVNALKDTAGSSADYQLNRTANLQLQEYLERLQKISPPYNSTIQFDHIHRQAQECEEILRSFLSETSKFGGALGPSAAKGWHHGSARKAQWALSSPVPKFRENLTKQLSLLHQELCSISLCVIVKNVLSEMELTYSHRLLSIDSTKRLTDMEMELYNVSTKIDHSLEKFDGLDVQMQKQAGYIESSSLASAGIDKLGFSIGAMRNGLDELNLAYSGIRRPILPIL